MRLFVMIAIVFYVVVISLVGFTSLLALADIIDMSKYIQFLDFLSHDPQANIVAGFVVASTMLISLIFARIIYGKQERSRNIAITNPLGRVTISVAALEDLVRRMVVSMPQIKEIRPDITSSATGLHIEVKLVLRSEANIPELTAELQEKIEAKVQDVLGSEERVAIRVHVAKITSDGADVNKGKDSGETSYGEEPPADVAMPFPGYKA